MTVIEPFWTQPSHPNVLVVDIKPGSFASSAKATSNFAKGTVLTKITSHTIAPEKAYSTVQVSKDSHIELNSDLLYCNHSCDPNVVFDMSKFEVRAIKDISIGDDITFFYPSTEWKMSQPFDCHCGTKRCLGRISGAADIPLDKLKTYELNDHIEKLIKEFREESN